MTRYALAVVIGVGIPSLAFAQTPSAQLTNDDLLRLIGLQQVQNLECGKQLDAVQRELDAMKAALAPKDAARP